MQVFVLIQCLNCLEFIEQTEEEEKEGGRITCNVCGSRRIETTIIEEKDWE